MTEFFVEYRSGEMDPEARDRFEAHLARCRDCLAYLRSYETTIRLAKGAFRHPDDPIPDDVPEDLVRAILAATKAR